MMTRLCLLRHGQTDWNVEGRWQGHADQPLNSIGLEQVAQITRELAANHFAGIYSSDLRRACVMAQAIAQKHNLPVKMDARLREINMGAWEGQLGTDIPALYPLEWADRLNSPRTARPSGGESLVDLSRRVIAAITEYSLLNPQETILIVSHGLSLAVFLCHIQAIPLQQAYDHIPKNARAIWIDWLPPD
jgi:broad specificity phosphatase PhoE